MTPHTYSNGHQTWPVATLWEAAKDLTPITAPIAEICDLDDLLDSHTWSDGPLSVREIVDHHERIQDADLSYPIILTPEGWIADGVHRIVKAHLAGITHLPVVRLTQMPPTP
jgi:hypothetical protein